MSLPDPINLTQWVEENRAQFRPPVGNMMMHGAGQMKLFFVGGPNERKDYHLEEGEELFFMIKGDMELKLVLGNEFVSQPIKQGQLFLLPGNVFHSPQRAENTVGWVIERERPLSERDGLLFFLESPDGTPTLQPLFERYVHMRDLGVQIAELIAEFRRSDECRTGRPAVASASEEDGPKPVAYKPEVRPPDPVTLADWLAEHRDELDAGDGADGASVLEVFPRGGGFQFLVEVVGRSGGGRRFLEAACETWLVQLAGEATVFVEGGDRRRMAADDSLLVPAGVAWAVEQGRGGRLLKAGQDRGRKAY